MNQMMRTNPTKLNPWTVGLAAAGVVSLASVASAEEAQHQVMTALSATTLSGYVDTSAIWGFGKGNNLVGRSFDQGAFQSGVATAAGVNKQDGFNLNVVKLQLSKPLDEGQWSAGYTVGLLFGPDANVLSSGSALAPGTVGTSDFAVKDAYVALRAPIGTGLDLKIGTWTTVLGYEVTEAGDNPNYSRSYGFYLEPIVHTGILASYKVCEGFSISGGVADRGDFNNINSRSGIESLKTYVGQVVLTAPESFGFLKGATAYAAVCDGGVSSPATTPGHASGSKDVVNFYAGATVPTPLEGLSVGVAFDYRASGVFDKSYENAIGGYAIYQATEKLKLATRTEYATSSGTGFGGTPTGNAQNVALLGNTVTLDYKLWENVISRLEFRWDHSMNGQRYFGSGVPDRRNTCSLALNVIYKF
jgi:hypothetical protein